MPKWSNTRQIKISASPTSSQVNANNQQMTIPLGHLTRLKLMYVSANCQLTTLIDIGFDQDPGEGMPMRLVEDVGLRASKQWAQGLDIEVQDFFCWFRGHLTTTLTNYFMVGYKTLERS